MLVLLSKDDDLNQRWLTNRKGGDTRFDAYTEPHELLSAIERQDIQHVVLSDRYFDFSSFGEYVESLKERQPSVLISVLLSDHHNRQLNERWMKTCLANGYFWVSPHRTKEMIVQQLLEHMIGIPPVLRMGGSKLLLFIGSTPNIGTTLISFGTAVQLARQTTHRIGYICLNLKSSKLHRYLGRERPGTTLDHLRAELRSKSLTPERLLQACESVHGVAQLQVLYGNMIREQAEYFTLEDIAHLLKIARSAFDLCVVEANAYWDNAGTLGAMLEADSKYWITTNELAHFQEDTNRWLHSLSASFGLMPSAFDLIVTQTDKQGGAGALRLKDIRRETGLHVFGQVHRYPAVSDYLNQGKLVDLLLQPHPIEKELREIADAIIRYHQLNRKPVTASPSTFRRLWDALGIFHGKGRTTKWEA
ncbi:CpaE family protein [Paenibacillus sp. HJGM_3]|uniref:AAA family ATPase n=1 Tax=Paenibacillus sp. HJGM_3 TaxID=3379816 RepID=UPI0038586AD3